MASPQHFFRRYQKALLAGGTVMLMIAFAITSVPNYFMEGRRQSDPVVFTTRKGEMREQELYGMMEARRMAHRFLYESVTLAVRNLMQQRELQSIPPGQIFEILLTGLANDGIEVRREVDEETFVRSLIIARKAEEVGISVSDEAINEFLRDRTLKKVTPEQFREIITSLKFPQRSLFDALRTELLSARLRQMVFAISAVRGTPPGLRWDYFERLNHRASAQTMALPVDGFLAQVGTPDEAQLQALYKEFKDDYAFPDSPEPGFHEPEKGKFEYFKADYEKFAAGIEISDAEIKDYYEKNKQTQFLYSGFQVAPPKTVTPAAEGKAPADDASKPAETTTPAGEIPAAETPAANEPPAAQPPATETPAAPPAEAAAPAEAAPPSGEPQSSGPQGAGGDDAGGQAAEPAAEAPAAETKTDTPATDEPALAQPTTTTEAPKAEGEATGTEAKTDEKPESTEGEAKGESAEEKKPDDKPAEPVVEPDETLMLPESILSGPNPDYEPLWRVEDRIRDLLRRQRVGEKVREVFQRLGDAVDEHANKLADHAEAVGNQGAEKAGAAPTAPDFAALATDAGVTFQTTPLISPFNAGDTELGKSFLNGSQPFSDAAFASLRLWIPRQSVDVDGNSYLFWKVEEKHDFVPTFEEAAETVTRTWKFQQASELALKKAKELADQANTSGKTLKELFGDAGTYQVSETGEFSWLTESAARSPEAGQSIPELTQIPGVTSAGDKFMRTVFTLQPSQAGAALNAPETVAYVVQVTGLEPADVVLRESFMVAPYRTYMGAALNDERDLVQSWIAQLEKEAGLDWVRPPNQRLR